MQKVQIDYEERQAHWILVNCVSHRVFEIVRNYMDMTNNVKIL